MNGLPNHGTIHTAQMRAVQIAVIILRSSGVKRRKSGVLLRGEPIEKYGSAAMIRRGTIEVSGPIRPLGPPFADRGRGSDAEHRGQNRYQGKSWIFNEPNSHPDASALCIGPRMGAGSGTGLEVQPQ